MLESILVKNLMKDSLKKECVHGTLAALEVGLAMKMGDDLKTKSLQASVDFLTTTLDENKEVKVCGLEYESRLACSAQERAVTQLMRGSGACSKTKWDDDHLSCRVPSFHEKVQTWHRAVARDLPSVFFSR